MLKADLKYLGQQILIARKEHGLTQQELANQTGLAVKTIQDIEKGRKNPTYETLARLIRRLGMSPDIIFPSKAPIPMEEIEKFLKNFQLCDPRGQDILLRTLLFLAEQLCPCHDEPN